VVEFLFPEPALRELLYLEAWMLGARPASLPACAFQAFLDRRYGYHRPFYPVDGAHAIAQALVGVITGAGGAVMTSCRVEAITVEQGDATGVLAQGTWIPAQRAVISNADLRTTLGLLRDAPATDGVAALLQRTSRYRAGFSLACLLLLATPDTPVLGWVTRRGYYQASTILMDSPVNDGLDALESGTLPGAPIMNLVSVEALIARKQHRLQPLPFVVLTLWPNAGVPPSARRRFVDHVVDRLEGPCPGFRRSILWEKLLDPAEYRAAFGISSCPAPVLVAPDYDKEAPALPIGRLFNVGTSVLPRGAHTGTAMESGRHCANLVLAAR
jgi:phytoene dehydrogenase-like protein